MRYSSREIGKMGEEIAVKFLRSGRFKILDRNFSCPLGEIDIVTRKNGRVIFFEVKTRTSDKFGHPLESITGQKKKHILRSCYYYLGKHNLFDNPYRVDAIGINLNPEGKFQILTHVKNILQDVASYTNYIN